MSNLTASPFRRAATLTATLGLSVVLLQTAPPLDRGLPAVEAAAGEPGPVAAGAQPVIRTGRQQTVLGPSGNIDSLYATVRDRRGVHAYMSNRETIYYDQKANGTLTNPRKILEAGPKGSIDHCGVHPVGGIYKASSRHWITFYHAERANPNQFGGKCYGARGQRNHTRWLILRLETFDAGRTWRKGPVVIRQDDAYMKWTNNPERADEDDAGSPRLVIHGKHMYLFYRAVNRTSTSSMRMSVARAPLSSLGRKGAWKKWYGGSYSEPGLGGRQDAVAGLPSTGRGISWNTYLNAYIAVKVDLDGITLYRTVGDDITR